MNYQKQYDDFVAAFKNWPGFQGHEFIRGYDDRQWGRRHAYILSNLAGDAYKAGWKLADEHALHSA